MHKLGYAMMVVSLGLGVALSVGAPYAEAARHLEINQATAAEVIKTDAHQAVMRDALDQPPLPAGMKLVLPQGTGPSRVLARSVAMA
jgi:hypothetical protein